MHKQKIIKDNFICLVLQSRKSYVMKTLLVYLVKQWLIEGSILPL